MGDGELLDLLAAAMSAADLPEATSAKRFNNGHTYGVSLDFSDGSRNYLTVSDGAGHMLKPAGRR